MILVKPAVIGSAVYTLLVSAILLLSSCTPTSSTTLLPKAMQRHGQDKEDEDAVHNERARDLCGQMTLDEKIALLHGVEGPYVGNVPPNERLNIPAINLNDGPQGFRGIPGTSTAWPCALSMAASWDEQLVFQWGQAMAQEFLDKGSNVFLGPGVNVIRIPQNGRNFEYLSGEDPVLGSKLVAAEIQGLQNQGVIANVKHFVHNNQETHRTTVDQVVDERTHWELYMPPFQAAVDAGVLSVMCSYNKVNGVYACENPSTLAGDLKRRLSFLGFIVSDWGATHSTIDAAKAGLDMEMPAGKYYGEALKKAVLAEEVSMELLDDKVQRTLFALSMSGSMGRPNDGSIEANVTSEAHNRLARELATAGVILLKNDNNRLPLQRNQKIHVIGDIIACGGGSGNVVPIHVISGYTGIQNHVNAVNSTGSVTYSAMNDTDNDEIEDADVVVIFTSTTSSEGSDRPDLAFPSHEIDVIDKVISVAVNKVVVVGTAPGAVLVPFADRVPGLVLSFMPGQEGGHAIADVLFGDFNPSAKLPLSLPNVENETGFSPEQYPGVNLTATYSEKLLTGYRWYDANQIKPKFGFGYGLSYTQFHYSDLNLEELPITSGTIGPVVALYNFTFKLSNVGHCDGHEIWQVYIAFPQRKSRHGASGEPPKRLKHFGKQSLTTGSSKQVSFALSEQDLSIWDVKRHSWQVVMGEFTVFVGPSSDSLPLQWTLRHEDDLVSAEISSGAYESNQ